MLWRRVVLHTLLQEPCLLCLVELALPPHHLAVLLPHILALKEGLNLNQLWLSEQLKFSRWLLPSDDVSQVNNLNGGVSFHGVTIIGWRVGP